MEKVILYNDKIIVKGFSIVAQSKADKSGNSAAETENIGDLNREKQSLMNELSVLSGESSASAASCMQFIPKDVKVASRMDVDIKKAPEKLIVLFALNKALLIKGAIFLSDKLFEGESLFV